MAATSPGTSPQTPLALTFQRDSQSSDYLYTEAALRALKRAKALSAQQVSQSNGHLYREAAPNQQGDQHAINFTKPHDYFGAFFHACMTPIELSKLNTVLQQGWSEDDLAEFTRWHTGRPFFAVSRRMLMAAINSALQRDRFAKRFLKERKQRPIALHASRPYAQHTKK
ncbi:MULTISPECIES: hypothetical protein [Bradyrhizobium]|uniref:hypothetical protein n=1 Tax=Bradyrhizobium TaxID=374 RepID=UPI001EDA26B4|nr:hypothetical protein [Bradyrhizobium zhengyangense]MCG2642443.1 hypothetical protein [Bradyrhizobium zhengyangense]